MSTCSLLEAGIYLIELAFDGVHISSLGLENTISFPKPVRELWVNLYKLLCNEREHRAIRVVLCRAEFRNDG